MSLLQKYIFFDNSELENVNSLSYSYLNAEDGETVDDLALSGRERLEHDPPLLGSGKLVTILGPVTEEVTS